MDVFAIVIELAVLLNNLIVLAGIEITIGDQRKPIAVLKKSIIKILISEKKPLEMNTK